ncbi:gamma-tubulin complex component 3 homolog isoform X2 [Cimex lectularius]|uniref:Gamma-tubulin complex component n=1 Tax=Cimex lectularius TaxID=79782 RepID=A0A8I6R7M3_CIMLE|nr:gamma-tubulin complex component 3 homolog isoform X2 [Cimex lectularius]
MEDMRKNILSFKPGRSVFQSPSRNRNDALQELLLTMQSSEATDMNMLKDLQCSVEYRKEHNQFSKQLAELGNLHEGIKLKMAKLQKCLVVQAVESVIYEKLNAFHMAIAEVNNWQEDIRCHTSVRRILPWARDSMMRLHFLSKFLDDARNEKGGAILNPILVYLPHGNNKIHELFLELFNKAAIPMIQMIWHWVVRGALNDPYDEFFVQYNSDCTMDEWHEQFVLRKDFLPSVINSSLGKLITATGKVMNFLNKYYPEKCSEIIEKRKNLYDFQEFSFPLLVNKEDEFQHYIKDIYTENSSIFLKMLEEKYMLSSFFKNIHDFFFLSQGHFARHFMISMYSEYSKSVNDVSLNHLNSLLASAIGEMMTMKSSDRIFNEVIVHLNTPTEKDTVADVFTLKYQMSPPLNQMFETFEISYRKIFRFLWSKNHVSYLLSNCWRSLRGLLRTKNLTEDLSYNLKRVYLFNNQLMQFTYQLDFYMIYEIVDRWWQTFMLCYKESNDIEEVLCSHAKMLSSILTGTLQKKHQAEVSIQLRHIVILISEIEELITNIYYFINNQNFSFEDSSLIFSAKVDVLLNTAETAVNKFSSFLKSCRHIHGLLAVYERINFNDYYKRDNDKTEKPLPKPTNVYTIKESTSG